MIDTKSLRKKILNLAVTGELSKHCPEDTEVSSALKSYIPSMDIELPEIPTHWKYCKFNEVLINRDSERIPVSVEDRKKFEKIFDYYGASGVIDKVDDYLFDETLLLIGEDGANLLSRSTPIAFLAHGKYWVNNHAHVIGATKHILLEYAEIVINSMSLIPFVTGSAQPKLSQNMMNRIAIPVPPLEEQRRIVDSVAQTFDILNTIDELQSAYSSDLEVLKSKVIDAGIQGKLTEQLPEDGNAEDLYAAIQEEKQKLIKEKKIKKAKALPEIAEDEIPFEIPENWKWVRIGELFTLQAGKNIPAGSIKESPDDVNIYPCYGGNGLRGYVSNSNVSGKHAIIGRQGALCGNINFAEADFYATEHAVVVYQYADVNVDWIGITLRALNLNQYATSVAQPGLAVSRIDKVLIPLPPLAEQERIVEKVLAIESMI